MLCLMTLVLAPMPTISPKHKTAGQRASAGGSFLLTSIFSLLTSIFQNYSLLRRFGPASRASCGQPSANSLKFSM